MRARGIELKSRKEIALMREAGLVVAEALAACRDAVAPGVSTAELDRVAARVIRGNQATPSFLGYNGFPATICASVNDEVVHGIPAADRVLSDGDIVSIDCGAIVSGWHGDAAITVPVGTVAPDVLHLLEVCEDSMWAGFGAAHLGGRVSDISHAVETTVRPHGYGVVDHYGGHGIGSAMHQDPHVRNLGPAGRGPKLVRGLALAIEPMVTMGSPDTYELDDGWTVVTADHSWAAHFEHTFTLTDDGPWILTSPDGGAQRLARLATATA